MMAPGCGHSKISMPCGTACTLARAHSAPISSRNVGFSTVMDVTSVSCPEITLEPRLRMIAAPQSTNQERNHEKSIRFGSAGDSDGFSARRLDRPLVQHRHGVVLASVRLARIREVRRGRHARRAAGLLPHPEKPGALLQ